MGQLWGQLYSSIFNNRVGLISYATDANPSLRHKKIGLVPVFVFILIKEIGVNTRAFIQSFKAFAAQLRHHVVAAEQLAGPRTGAIVAFESLHHVDDGVAKAGRVSCGLVKPHKREHWIYG